MSRINTIKVLIVEPWKVPYEADIPNDLKSLQNLVGGLIQVLYAFFDEEKNLHRRLNLLVWKRNNGNFVKTAHVYFAFIDVIIKIKGNYYEKTNSTFTRCTSTLRHVDGM